MLLIRAHLLTPNRCQTLEVRSVNRCKQLYGDGMDAGMADLDLFAGVQDIARGAACWLDLRLTSGIFRIQLCLSQV